MLVSFHKTSPSLSLWSVFALVVLSTLIYMFISLSAIMLFTEQIVITENLEKM